MPDESNTQEPSGRYGGRKPEADEVEGHAHGSWREEDPSGRYGGRTPEDDDVDGHLGTETSPPAPERFGG